MPLPPEHYATRATDLETAATNVTDPTIKAGYLDLAAKYREMAARALEIRKKAAELDLLAENMVRVKRRPD